MDTVEFHGEHFKKYIDHVSIVNSACREMKIYVSLLKQQDAMPMEDMQSI